MGERLAVAGVILQIFVQNWGIGSARPEVEVNVCIQPMCLADMSVL